MHRQMADPFFPSNQKLHPFISKWHKSTNDREEGRIAQRGWMRKRPYTNAPAASQQLQQRGRRRRTAAAVHWVATKAPNGRAAGFFFGVWEEALGRNPPHLGQKPAVHLRNLGGSGWGALGQPVNVSETLQNWPESRRHISNDHMAPRERSLSLDGESVFSRRAGAWAKSASD